LKNIESEYIRKLLVMLVQFFGDEESDNTVICGTDEAGRGPLAGPVVVASVVLSPDFPFEILNDSKKLKEKDRIRAEKVIRDKALAFCVKAVPHTVIDRINILNASLLGMRETAVAVYSKIKFDILLADGNRTPDVPFPVEAVVKGDAKIHEIMAASILAKNERDRIMVLADRKWPQYGFASHKGYPTKEHYEALAKYGPCPIHRLSFRLTKDEKTEEEQTLF
jgi:ribonuclease HII